MDIGGWVGLQKKDYKILVKCEEKKSNFNLLRDVQDGGIPEAVGVRREGTGAVGAAWRSPGRGSPGGFKYHCVLIEKY